MKTESLGFGLVDHNTLVWWGTIVTRKGHMITLKLTRVRASIVLRSLRESQRKAIGISEYNLFDELIKRYNTITGE